MNLLFWYRSLMRSVGAALVKLIATATSGLVSFTTNVIRPVKVTCEFSPIQEGTGDPSPDNVRPISGWTRCEIGHTGKNLFDGTVTNARIQNGVVVATGSYRLSEYIRVNPETSYALIDKDGNLSQIFAHFFDENKTFLQSITTTEGIVVSPAGASYMRFHVTARAFGDQKPFMLFEGSTATAYEPYQGATLPITFTDPTTGDLLTVYGGTVTLNEDGSADLFTNYVIYQVTSDKLVLDNGTRIRNTPKMGQGPQKPAYCNVCTYNSSQALSLNPSTPACFAFSGNNVWFSPLTQADIALTPEERLANWKAYVDENSVYIIYKAGNAIYHHTYHFSSITQLNAFLGQNNIWHNMNGSITAEYYKKQ